LARTVKKVLLWEEIISETVQVYSIFLNSLEAAGYVFSGFVIDGRRGVLKLLENRFPQTPDTVLPISSNTDCEALYSRKSTE